MPYCHRFVFTQRFPEKVGFGGITYTLECNLNHDTLCLTVTKEVKPPVQISLTSGQYGIHYMHQKLYIEGFGLEPKSAACRFMQFMVKSGHANVSEFHRRR